MTRANPSPSRTEPGFDEACDQMATLLGGEARRAIVADAAKAGSFERALLRLRDAMRAHTWRAGGVALHLDRWVTPYDRRTRREGFHALNDWDGVADQVNPDIIPVDVLHYLVDQRREEPCDEAALAILLDYYVMHLLSLLTLRVWDEGDANANLDRVGALLLALQGPDGSGQGFAADAETLLLIATSHFELEERGYQTLLERVRTLDAPHRTRVALGHAASMGSHLRFGFEATYARVVSNMRNDNVADYPWLCFAVSTVLEEYLRMREAGVTGEARETVVEALLNGLSPDARAFLGPAPPSLAAHEAERTSVRERLEAHKADLLAEFEAHRPAETAYSPLGFFFNFSHNVVKGAVVDALLWGQPRRLTLNDLLTGVPRGGAGSEAKTQLARTLMGHARHAPQRIRGKLMPVIVYDPAAGRQAFAATMRALRGQG